MVTIFDSDKAFSSSGSKQDVFKDMIQDEYDDYELNKYKRHNNSFATDAVALSFFWGMKPAKHRNDGVEHEQTGLRQCPSMKLIMAKEQTMTINDEGVVVLLKKNEKKSHKSTKPLKQHILSIKKSVVRLFSSSAKSPSYDSLSKKEKQEKKHQNGLLMMENEKQTAMMANKKVKFEGFEETPSMSSSSNKNNQNGHSNECNVKGGKILYHNLVSQQENDSLL